MRALVIGVLLAIPALGLVGCFEYDEPLCSFKCGLGGDCPDDYECRNDGYCHRQDSTEVCTFSDAAIANDLSAAIDQGGDLTMPVDSGTD